MSTNMPDPTPSEARCSNCGGTAFWAIRPGLDRCSRCHPAPTAPPVRTWTVPRHPLAGKRVSAEEIEQRFSVKH